MQNINLLNGMPMGLGMALGENLPVLNYFSGLGNQKQQDIIANTALLSSKQEMKDYVNSYFIQYPHTIS